ncbi:16S rRNA (cytosine(967)-C(5))-methyltransferase RsmB [Chromatocurvus halotolerans]|uniref:16S rRNA (cytosine(967)-C(5))-methyltransferase RsmB n=1 Tax=Chromatocurvus halotolerans TaxID=1132028 RepID=UPI001F0C31CE|nr:16S rRNA (cytosine(967)-C(5))-methyltransferase RsmB [Chromatocurvus halotolerans]
MLREHRRVTAPSACGVRATAATVLAQVLAGSTLDGPLAQAMPGLAERDRPLLAQLCYGSLRLAPRLQALLTQLLDKPLRERDSDVQALLMLGLYQLSDSRIPDHAAVAATVEATRELGKPWAKGLVNAVLRRYGREAEALAGSLSPAAAAAHPQWLYEALHAAWPDYAISLLATNNQQPPMVLRVNRLKVSRDDWIAQLAACGIPARAGILTREAVYLAQPVGVDQLPDFAAGAASVQDEAAQLAAQLLGARPGDHVLDACAAPGGKTCHLLEAVPDIGSVTAMDIDAERLRRVRENLNRLQLDAKLVTANAAEATTVLADRQFDRILVDAPCSATGVIRRHPDIKLLRRAQDIAQFAAQQLQILSGVWPHLRPGGRLLYVTCSVLPEENQAVVAGFLARQDNAGEVSLPDIGLPCMHGRQIMPRHDGPDGLYFALLEKHR